MFVFGHLGFGHQLLSPWRSRLDRWSPAIGMLLPDVIDKPLYYLRYWDYVTSTRTFGHTALLCLAMTGAGYVLRRRSLIGIGLGVATHDLLDLAMDLLFGVTVSSTWMAVVWPLSGAFYVETKIPSIAAHTGLLLNGPIIATEIIGFSLLAWAYSRRGRG